MLQRTLIPLMSLLKPIAQKAVVDMKNNQVTITVNGDEIRMDQLGNAGDKTSPCFFNICTTLCCLCYLLMQM